MKQVINSLIVPALVVQDVLYYNFSNSPRADSCLEIPTLQDLWWGHEKKLKQLLPTLENFLHYMYDKCEKDHLLNTFTIPLFTVCLGACSSAYLQQHI